MQRPFVTSASYRAAIGALVESRRAQGITQAELAAALGKPRSFVSKIEHVERRVDIVEFIAIARALQLDPAELTTRVAASLPEDLEF